MSSPFSSMPFANLPKAQLDGLLTLANTTFAGMERLAALNLSLARSLFEDSATSARALLGAKDFEDFVAIQGNLTQPAVDKAVLWSREACAISAETGAELNHLIEGQLSAASETLNSTLDEMVRHTPAGADAAVSASVNALKSALSSAACTYASLSQTARQAAEAAPAPPGRPPQPAAAKPRKS